VVQPVVQQDNELRPRKARLNLRNQFQNEEIADFLKHAELFFALDHTDEEAKIGHLMTKVRSEVGKVIETLFSSGQHPNYEEISNHLLEQFAISRFDRLTRFRQLKPNGGENIIQYGAKLRAEYLKYVLITEQETAPMEVALKAALMEQLFATIDNQIAAHVRNKINEDPALTWEAILKLTENFRQTHSKMAFSQSMKKPEGSSWCNFHKAYGHSSFNCRDKQFAKTDNPTAVTNQEPSGNEAENQAQNRCFKCNRLGHKSNHCTTRMAQIRCYKCNQMGHIAPNCQTMTGNEKTGRTD
jgi:hypothetical protein